MAAAQTDQVQRRMSVAFPADLVASLPRHDGTAPAGFSLPPFLTPMGSLTELLEQTARSLEIGRAYDGRYRPKVSPDQTLDWEIL